MTSQHDKVKEICGGLRPLLFPLNKTESASQRMFTPFHLLGLNPVVYM